MNEAWYGKTAFHLFAQGTAPGEGPRRFSETSRHRSCTKSPSRSMPRLVVVDMCPMCFIPQKTWKTWWKSSEDSRHHQKPAHLSFFHMFMSCTCDLMWVLSYCVLNSTVRKNRFFALATVLRRRRFLCNRRLCRRGKWRAKRATEPRSATKCERSLTERIFLNSNFMQFVSIILFLSVYSCFDLFWSWFGKDLQRVKPGNGHFEGVCSYFPRCDSRHVFLSVAGTQWTGSLIQARHNSQRRPRQ